MQTKPATVYDQKGIADKSLHLLIPTYLPTVPRQGSYWNEPHLPSKLRSTPVNRGGTSLYCTSESTITDRASCPQHHMLFFRWFFSFQANYQGKGLGFLAYVLAPLLARWRKTGPSYEENTSRALIQLAAVISDRNRIEQRFFRACCKYDGYSIYTNPWRMLIVQQLRNTGLRWHFESPSQYPPVG